jgi:hypothetical protein
MPRKKALTDQPATKVSEGKKMCGLGYVRLKHTLPAAHLTIECKMVEQKKKAPTDWRTLANGSKDQPR